MRDRFGLRLFVSSVLVPTLFCACAVETGDAEQVDAARAELLSTTSCPPGSNIIQGTSLANTLNGTPGRDCILGHGGNDTINGLGGDDVLIGGAGNDTIRGGDGADTIYGEDGADKIYGDVGDDIIDTGTGTSATFLSANGDNAWGGPGSDVIKGGSAADKLYGEGGADTIAGGGAPFLLSDTIDGGSGIDQCKSGTACELPEPTVSCNFNEQCNSQQVCVVQLRVCALKSCAGPDVDADGICDAVDSCPADGTKITPQVCGCGVSELNSDGDSAPNCIDACPNNAPKVAPGVCGCAVADTDSDGDGTANCVDVCRNDPSKIAPGVCGCGVTESDADGDGDGTVDCIDGCPTDPAKNEFGLCGCGISDVDSDDDGAPDCWDECPSDSLKFAPEICGCGVPDVDSDGDGTLDCVDGCPSDALKVAAGGCGCGAADVDADGDGAWDCVDGCPSDAAKVAAGACGCGVSDADDDADGVANCLDSCPQDPNDSDLDTVCDSHDACPGFDDRIDDNHDTIPDDCEECRVAADCDDGNPCTVDTCVAQGMTPGRVCRGTVAIGQSCGDGSGMCGVSGTCVTCEMIALGDLAGGPFASEGLAVSDDGTTVTGRSKTATYIDQVFRWTEASGMAPIGLNGSGLAISGDGSVIVGTKSNSGGNTTHGFWERVDGIDILGASQYPRDITPDGLTIVGDHNGEAFRMRGDTRIWIMYPYSSTANGVSANGNVVVGSARFPNSNTDEPYVWSNVNDPIALGDLRGTHSGSALAVSPDGRFVVGTAASPYGTAGFSWTRESGLNFLDVQVTPKGVTDHYVIVGAKGASPSTSAWVFGSLLGGGTLQPLLQQCGLDMTGWTLTTINGVTPDGRTMVGTGVNPSGNTEAVLIRLR